MDNGKMIIFGIVVLCCLIQQSVALNCYSCIGCGDPFNKGSYSTVNCTADLGSSYTNTAYCSKSVATAAGLTVVTRSCQAACTQITASVAGVGANVYCCQTDGCNSSNSVISNKFFTLGLVAIAAFLSIRKF